MDFKLLTRCNLNAIHGLSCLFGMTVPLKLNNCVAFVHVSDKVFGEVDRDDVAKWTEEFLYFFLVKHAKCASETSNVDPVILISL